MKTGEENKYKRLSQSKKNGREGSMEGREIKHFPEWGKALNNLKIKIIIPHHFLIFYVPRAHIGKELKSGGGKGNYYSYEKNK